MTAGAPVDPGSFRDRQSRVLEVEGRIVRLLSPSGWEEWRALAGSGLLERLVADRLVPGTRETAIPAGAATLLPDGVAGALEHDRVPFVSYPYEWSFSMLREAARVQLEVLVRALAAGFALKDASAYNLQWSGGRAQLIDLGSFERRVEGEPWVGYLQFCQLFLYPLLLTAYRDVPFQPWLRGALEGITPEQCRRLLRGRDLLRPGVAADVVLQAQLVSRAADARRSLRQELRGAGNEGGMSAAMVRRNLERLQRIVDGLQWRRASSAWSRYADDCHYADADREAKRALVERAGRRRPRARVWDLGANTGEYARLVAPHAGLVVAMDRDHLAVDLLFRRLRDEGPANVLPLVVDLLDPSPGIGWRGRERRPLEDRGRPDLVLALALLHHLVIGGNLPLREVITWLADLGADAVVEMVTKDDPMARRLLLNKDDQYGDYTPEAFERLASERFRIVERLPLAAGTRILYELEARRS
jgi:hypothetical protein